MPKAENKKPIGVPQSLYNEMEKYAEEQGLFLFEVVTLAWEGFKNSKTSPEKAKELLYQYSIRQLRK
jgi:hypothetical protein